MSSLLEHFSISFFTCIPLAMVVVGNDFMACLNIKTIKEDRPLPITATIPHEDKATLFELRILEHL